MADIDDIFAEYEGGADKELIAVRTERAYHLDQAAMLSSRESLLAIKLAKAAAAKAAIIKGASGPAVLADVAASAESEDLDGP